MTDANGLATALSSPARFSIRDVSPDLTACPVNLNSAPLGPLTAFTGNWIGSGFNTIFRPFGRLAADACLQSADGLNDAVLELNITSETMSFAPNLGSIPNRGFYRDPPRCDQKDIYLNGVPYLQTINDITTLPPRGIHFEPGIWLYVPATTVPRGGGTLARMASIPHGATLNAQGAFKTGCGKPVIHAVKIRPAGLSAPSFPNLIADNQHTFRLPQDLTSFIAEGTITQAMLDDPNTVLRRQIANQSIRETITIEITTAPSAPLVGGGLTNIAFLRGDDKNGPNAEAVRMDAQFFIETVMYRVAVPPINAGDAPLVLSPVQTDPPVPLVPKFSVSIPFVEGKRFAGGTITVCTTQIQYSQKVLLHFNEINWPHVSVASLVPADPIPVPADLLPLT
jgi:hypothetical protein